MFANQTLETGLAETITEELGNEIVSYDELRTVTNGADATITGVVVGYSNEEYQYDIRGERDVDVSEYMVKISVRVSFMDNRKNEPLFEGTVTGQGQYAFGTEQESAGRARAVEDVVKQIMQNSVQSW